MTQWNDYSLYYDLYIGQYLRKLHAPPVAVLVAVALAAAIVFLLWRSRRNYEKLAELEAAPEGFQPDVTVVIPARDEEANITEAVMSFSGYPVVVVDDESSDRTAEVAARAGATVIPSPPLWIHHKGKPNACAAGAKEAQSKWILFVDADTRYRSEAVPALVHFAEVHKLDAVSMLLRQDKLTLLERTVLPYAFALYFCGVSSRKVNRTRSADALANGQCFLVRRDTYEETGGHRAVLESVIDDVALARHLKRCRKKVRVVRGEAFGWVRMYNSLEAIWRGFEKNAFRFLMVSPWMGFQVALSSVLLTSWLPMLVWLLLEAQWMAAAVFALLPCWMLRKWYGSLREALLAPAAIYIFEVIAVAGMYHSTFSRTTYWKGREV